jgi:hypothetical protein
MKYIHVAILGSSTMVTGIMCDMLSHVNFASTRKHVVRMNDITEFDQCFVPESHILVSCTVMIHKHYDPRCIYRHVSRHSHPPTTLPRASCIKTASTIPYQQPSIHDFRPTFITSRTPQTPARHSFPLHLRSRNTKRTFIPCRGTNFASRRPTTNHHIIRTPNHAALYGPLH